MGDKPEFKSLVEIKKRPELRYNITSTTKTVHTEEPAVVAAKAVDVEDEIVEVPDQEVEHTEDDEEMLNKIDAEVKLVSTKQEPQVEVHYETITSTKTIPAIRHDEPETTEHVISHTHELPTETQTVVSNADFKKMKSKSKLTYLFSTVTVIR